MFAGWFKTGAGSEWNTVIVKDFVSLSLFAVAATEAENVPNSATPGARWMFPVAVPMPGEIVTTVMDVGPDTLEKVIGSPSASVALIAWSAVDPVQLVVTVMFAMGSRTGAAAWAGLGHAAAKARAGGSWFRFS